MQTLRFDIPVEKIPALATSAILAGMDLGAWASQETKNEYLASLSSPEPVPYASIPATQPEKEEEEAPTAPDFFADIV